MTKPIRTPGVVRKSPFSVQGLQQLVLAIMGALILVGAVAGTLLLAVMPYPLLVPVALLGLLLLI